MLELTGHHTCENQGNGKLMEKEGFPKAISVFNAKADIEKDRNAFLGTGYYFWDYNIAQARYWGRKQYGHYYIFQSAISYDESMLDLVGNRIHIEYFLNLMKDLSDLNPTSSKWKIGQFIEFMKELAEEDDDYKEMFPYKSIRAIDNQATISEYEFDFDGSGRSYINLNPRIMICVISLDKTVIKNFTLIETI